MDKNRVVMKVIELLSTEALAIRVSATCYGQIKRTPAQWLQAMLDDTF